MSVPELLWTKKASHFRLDILVGKAWVEGERIHGELDTAKAKAAELLADRSVAAVRLTEHDLVHTCHQIDLSEITPAITEAKLPRNLKRTGRTGTCRKCYGKTDIVVQGSELWSFCPECASALPCS